MKEQLKLSQLNRQIKNVIDGSFNVPIWVVAEISEMNINRNGHCYLDLIEKDEDTDRVIARARATIWSYSFRMLKPYFETTTNQRLTQGLKVLVSVSVEFHELYGFSLNIRDIDPTYTLGDMERKRREIIQRLKDDGVFELNKELELPMVPQKIAVISSPTAAGYQDFMNQLENNSGGYCFYTSLFSAAMQGNDAEASIIDALDRIYTRDEFFDVVVIIRGGGASADLGCFDSYDLALNITQFPLPVFTGIGHEKDDTITDLVAHTRLKTPTAVAEHLITLVSEFDAYLDQLKNDFISEIDNILTQNRSVLENYTRTAAPLIRERLSDEHHWLKHQQLVLAKETGHYFADQNHALERLHSGLSQKVNARIREEQFLLSTLSRTTRLSNREFLQREERNLEKVAGTLKSILPGQFANQKLQLSMFEQKNRLLDPENILKRGYSLVLKEGKILKSIEQAEIGERIETRLSDGVLISTVEEINS